MGVFIMAVLSKEDYNELIRICQDTAFAEVGASELIFAWPGNRMAIQRSNIFVMAAVMASSLRLHFAESCVESPDSLMGECLRQNLRDYDLYLPGMMAALRDNSLNDDIRNYLRIE
jgi:hypothetical protein